MGFISCCGIHWAGCFRWKEGWLKDQERSKLCAVFSLSLLTHHPDLRCHCWIPPWWHQEACGWVQWGADFALGTHSKKRSCQRAVVARGQEVSAAGFWGIAGAPGWADCPQITGGTGRQRSYDCILLLMLKWCCAQLSEGFKRNYFSKDNFGRLKEKRCQG